MNESLASDDGRLTLGTLWFAALLMAVTAVPAFSSFALGTLGPSIVDDVGLTRTQFGTLTTALYLGASAASPVMGRASDAWTARTALAVMFALAVVTLFGLGMAPRYWSLLLFSTVAGAGQACANPLGNKLVAEHVHQSRRGLIMGAKQSGAPLGAIVAGSFLPLLALAMGWRGALVVSSGLVLMVYLAIVQKAPATLRVTKCRTGDGGASGTRGGVLLLSVYAFLMGSGSAVVTAYLPLYAHESLGLTAAVAGTLIGAMGLTGVIGRISLGYFLDRASVASASILAVLALTATIAVAFLLAAEIMGVGLAWIGAVLFGVSMAWNTVVMVATIQAADRGSVGRASGLVMVGFFGGFVVAPVAFGASVDALSGYLVPWLALTTVLGATAFTTALWHRRTRTRASP